MFRKISCAICMIFLVACSGKKKAGTITSLEERPRRASINTDCKTCLPQDSIINNSQSVRYIIQDTTFDVCVRIDNKDTLLGFGFDCSAPPGLIPELYEYNEKTICLRHGYGEHFREFIICRLVSNSFEISTYEIALAFNKKNNTVIYRDYDSLQFIYVKDIELGKVDTIVLPDNLKYKQILSANLAKRSVNLRFENQQQVNYALNRN